jgi:hypothetical protein
MISLMIHGSSIETPLLEYRHCFPSQGAKVVPRLHECRPNSATYARNFGTWTAKLKHREDDSLRTPARPSRQCLLHPAGGGFDARNAGHRGWLERRTVCRTE